MLTEATDGSFYGTAPAGGGVCLDSNGCGAIFKITPEGVFIPVYTFCSLADCADGYDPDGGLVQGANGNFYGTTASGGAHGEGTVFKITPSGTLTTLYSFCTHTNPRGYCLDGSLPAAPLTLTENGDLYGTTYYGGAKNYGTIFKITPQGSFVRVYSFSSTGDGSYPAAGLMQATDGNLYGTTLAGGNIECGYDGFGCGTIFEVGAGGTLSTLHAFDGADGSQPLAGLTQATDGILYGTTSGNTIFSLSMGLGPFVETLLTSGRIDELVTILGTNLTGSTNVSFNGASARFTVISGTEITATVPPGATAGFVTVTTPSGTLKSNKPFRVIP